jgi:hypothetical protein
MGSPALLWVSVGVSLAVSGVALGFALSAGGGSGDPASDDPGSDALATRPTTLRLVTPRALVPTTTPIPHARLRVFADGCGVIRSAFPGGEPRSLQWSIVDPAGFQVLGRNALGETRYRYFASGTFTVVLKSWDGTKYAPASNSVTIHC